MFKPEKNRFNNPGLNEAYLNGDRIYRLSGFTTVDKVDRKARNIAAHFSLVRLIAVLVVGMIFVILADKYNPFKDTKELKRIFGFKGIYDSEQYLEYQEQVKREKEAEKEREKAEEESRRRQQNDEEPAPSAPATP